MYLDQIKERFEQAPIPMYEPYGVEPEQIAELEAEMGLSFPAAYTEFLLWTGNNASLLLDYSKCDFDELSRLRREVSSVLYGYSTDEAELTIPEDALVFWSVSNSFQFYFMRTSEGANPPVYSGDARKQADGFNLLHARLTDFILEATEREIAARLARTAYFSADAGQIRPTNFLASAKALWQTAGLPAPVGFSPPEVLQIERETGFIFPPAFREYLLWMGKDAGTFWQNNRDFERHVRFLRPLAVAVLQIVEAEELLPNEAFVFAYQFDAYFLYLQVSEGDDPPVHRFNIQSKQFELNIAPTFSGYLENALGQYLAAR